MPTPKNIVGAMVVDKDGNKQTIMNMSNARRKTYAQYQQMSEAQRKGVVIVEDYPIPENSDSVSVTADGVKTYGQLLNELYALIDTDKVTETSILIFENRILYRQNLDNSNLGFYRGEVSGGKTAIREITINSNSSLYVRAVCDTSTDYTSSVMPNNSSITLIYDYYNTLDIHTEYLAENCYLADGTTVEDRIPASYTITLPTSGYTSGSVTIWGESLTLYSIVISTDKDGNPLTNFTSGMTEDYPINVSGSQTDFNKVYAFSIGNGNVTFYLTSAPSTAFNVLIKEAI